MSSPALPASLRLTSSAALAWSSILLVQEILLLAFFIAGTHGLLTELPQPGTTDFASFYAAGALADQGTPALAYDRIAHHRAEAVAATPGANYVFFFYPPVFLLLCGLLARLPYLAAFLTFQTVTLLLYLHVMGRILAQDSRSWIVPVVAFPPVLCCVGYGQNALLTAALFGTATLLLERRPLAAGAAIGALCYKPHFGVLLPFALLARGQWRAFAAATIAAGALILVSLAWFGRATWVAYLAAFRSSPAIYESGQISFINYITPFGAARLVGLPVTSAYAVQIGVALACLGLVIAVWRSDATLPVRAATLVSATLLTVPLALYYDLLTATIAIAWLVRDGQADPLTRLEKASFVAVYVISLFQMSVANTLSLPIGVLPAGLLLALSVSRAWRHRARNPRPPPPAG